MVLSAWQDEVMALKVVVIGAGVIGSSVALAMARAGHDVVVVDRNSSAGMGSTSSSSAVIRFNYSTRDAVNLAWEAYHYWKRWPEFLGVELSHYAEISDVGVAMLEVPIISTENSVALFREVGIPHEVWDGERLRKEIPGIDAGKYWPPKPVKSDEFWSESAQGEIGCVYTPQGGYVSDPLLAAENLAAAAKAAGAKFRFKSEVVGFDFVEVATGDGVRRKVAGIKLRAMSSDEKQGESAVEQVAADVIVNVAGPWSSAINALAGVGSDFTVSVRPMRQEVHQLKSGPGGLSRPIVGDLDLGVYSRSAPGGMTLFGGTEPECDPLQWIDDVDLVNPKVTNEVFESQSLRIAKRFPSAQIPNAPMGVVGVYDVSSDWTPIYDRSEVDGFYLAIGTSGNQFKNAPVAGLVMRAIIEGVESGADHDSQPIHYQCEITGATINLGSFSRKRERNEKSSGTVMG
jgi:glycine/D-amino acid oxidase-like deaminating enzyme